MWTYNPPLRDMQFVIEEVLDAPSQWREIPCFADLDPGTAGAILEEAGKFATGVLAPINGPADLEGCTLRDGAVRTPAGYREAYDAFVKGGWAALVCDSEDGGQGLPALLNAAFDEMINAVNHGWTMYPSLLRGAYRCLREHGSAELKAAYLAKVVSGESLTTMNLTEPQAGSDLSLVRTKAEPQADGSFRITGNKIFISGGEHDLTENIIHLVLARLPDAPAGTKGLSLFLVPKLLPDGRRNAVHCDGIEKKMGIKGSATCAMRYESATGWLVGEANRGLAAMFVMMNTTRLAVAVQGLSHLDMAQQNAVAYARSRVQGQGKAIAEHPAVRRTLWRLRALTEGERVIAYWAAMLLDESRHHANEIHRQRADSLLQLLTPILKAFLSENGYRGASEAQQVWGGFGYVHEYGIEQTVRDSRIAMIYEGTNEIQAIDLLQRKVLPNAGATLSELFTLLERDAAGEDEFALALRQQVNAARTASAELIDRCRSAPDWGLYVAEDYLRALGFMLLAWAWLRIARAAGSQAGDSWYVDKLQAARFGVQWLLPEAQGLWHRVRARDAELPAAPL